MAIDVSLYDGLSAVAGIAVSVASFGTATPIVAAAIMGGIAMAHATAGLLTDHMNIDEWGAEMLKSGVTGVTSAFGGPVAQSLGGLVSSGIGVDPNGGLSFNLSDQALVSWGASTLLNTINIGGIAQDALGGAGKSVFMNALAMGVGQGVNGFLSDSLGQGINMAYDPSLQFDWGSAGRSFGVGTVSGMATGFMNSAMGGTYYDAGYDEEGKYQHGGYQYLHRDGREMFYSDKLSSATSTMGGFLGEWTDKTLGGSFDMSFGGNLGFHWGTNGVSMDHNASGISIGNMLQSLGNLKYAKLHSDYRKNLLGPVSRSNSRSSTESINDFKFVAVLNRGKEEEWDGYGYGEGSDGEPLIYGGTEPDFDSQSGGGSGGSPVKGIGLEQQAEQITNQIIRDQINNLDYEIVNGKVLIDGKDINISFEKYKQNVLKQLEYESDQLLVSKLMNDKNVLRKASIWENLDEEMSKKALKHISQNKELQDDNLKLKFNKRKGTYALETVEKNGNEYKLYLDKKGRDRSYYLDVVDGKSGVYESETVTDYRKGMKYVHTLDASGQLLGKDGNVFSTDRKKWNYDKTPEYRRTASMTNAYKFNQESGSFDQLVYTDEFLLDSDGYRIKQMWQWESPWGKRKINGTTRTMKKVGCVLTSVAMHLQAEGYDTDPGLVLQSGVKNNKKGDNAFVRGGASLDKFTFLGRRATGNKSLIYSNDIYAEVNGESIRRNEQDYNAQINYNTGEILTDSDSRYTEILKNSYAKIEGRFNDEKTTLLRMADPDSYSTGHTMLITGVRTDASGQVIGYNINDPGWWSSTYLNKNGMTHIKKQKYVFKGIAWYE